VLTRSSPTVEYADEELTGSGVRRQVAGRESREFGKWRRRSGCGRRATQRSPSLMSWFLWWRHASVGKCSVVAGQGLRRPGDNIGMPGGALPKCSPTIRRSYPYACMPSDQGAKIRAAAGLRYLLQTNLVRDNWVVRSDLPRNPFHTWTRCLPCEVAFFSVCLLFRSVIRVQRRARFVGSLDKPWSFQVPSRSRAFRLGEGIDFWQAPFS
jgi:hypothetical protein